MKKKNTVEKQESGFNGFWTPSEIFFNHNITSTEKLLFGVILHLTESKRRCFESNEYLASMMGVTKRSITNGISNLKQHKYITVEVIKRSGLFDLRSIHINPNYMVIYSSLSVYNKYTHEINSNKK